MQDKIIKTAELVINDFPRYFNMVRDPDKMYDSLELYQILHKAGVVNKAYDLTDEIISSSCVFSTRLNSIVTVIMIAGFVFVNIT